MHPSFFVPIAMTELFIITMKIILCGGQLNLFVILAMANAIANTDSCSGA